jgi:hypothetical protein
MAEVAQPVEASPVTLLTLFLNREDWSLGFSMNIWVILTLTIISALIIGLRLINGKIFFPQYEIDQAEIGVGDQKVTLKPNYSDRQVAYAVWVELSTRKIGLEIDFEHDVIAEIYNSWYEYFSVTRELIKGISVSQIQNSSTRIIINLSIDVLNQGLRPHLTKWHARFRRWFERELKKYEQKDDTEALDLQQIQKTFPQYEELKNEMEIVNKRLIAYRKKMQELVFGNLK